MKAADATADAADLYADYCDWSRALGLRTMTKTAFGRAMTDQREVIRTRTDKKRGYAGLAVEKDSVQQLELPENASDAS